MLARETDEEDNIFVCAGCGIAFFPLEIAAEFDGRFVDYDSRAQGVANIVYCGECWGNVKDNLCTSKEDARARREAMQDRLSEADSNPE